jgi:hypothetical protein
VERPFRLGLLADGPVGRAAVEFVVANHRQHLKLLVANTPDFLESVGVDAATDAAAVMLWQELLTEEGRQKALAQDLDAVVLCWCCAGGRT